MKRLNLSLIATLFSVIFLLLPFSAQAVGIQVSPSKIDADYDQTKGDIKLLVTNPTSNVELYKVYADDFADSLIINPQSFTLEAGAQRIIVVKLEPKSQGTIISTNLSVVSSNLTDSQLAAATGVKIPVTIRYSGQHFYWYSYDTLKYGIAGLALVLASLAGWILKRYWRKKV